MDERTGGSGQVDVGVLLDVRLVSLPVALHQRATQHLDELQREFVYIAVEPGGVPARMLDLGRRVRSQFEPFARGPQQTLEAAIGAGTPAIDLVYRVPAQAAAVGRAANAMLDEVDEFCAQGGMLTLAPAPEVLAYRRWFFGEFEAQIEGSAPTPWPVWAGRHLAG